MTTNTMIDLTDEHGPDTIDAALAELVTDAWAYVVGWSEPGEVLFIEALTCVSAYGLVNGDSIHRTFDDMRKRVLELAA